uniref:Uncharacterized protein n=1 Tax=Lates calcarifer TaxID=8187 RepID=A0A4W6DCQ6_LATCA
SSVPPALYVIMLLTTHPGPAEPTENLWWIIKRSVSKHKPKNVEELKAVTQEEWDKIPPQQYERLVGNMPARIRALLFEHILLFVDFYTDNVEN